ncbi:hypothetical protein AMECASPLE_016492 [Ameca splendens]|uniref:Uncharacterized protein n=1 Tax=Ameca splendens TaxID=208324 RepID=A0ABV0XF83_9TELE
MTPVPKPFYVNTTSKRILYEANLTSQTSNRPGHLVMKAYTIGASRTTSCLLYAKVFSILSFTNFLLFIFMSKSKVSPSPLDYPQFLLMGILGKSSLLPSLHY